eukprot:SAG31_NODE_3461_length_4248_cov_1.470234_3_plen_46_part_00
MMMMTSTTMSRPPNKRQWSVNFDKDAGAVGEVLVLCVVDIVLPQL